MEHGTSSVWDGVDLNDLLALEASGPACWRSRLGDPNSNGRVFGGQLLAQTLLAAGQTVPGDRGVTAMQVLFLRGASAERSIDYHVTPLLEGKRFSVRHVRAEHPGDRAVIDAQVSFGVPLAGPVLMASPAQDIDIQEVPEDLPQLSDCPADVLDGLSRAFNYPPIVKQVLDFRLPVSPAFPAELPAEARFRYWVKIRHALGDRPLQHAAAFAYLSDWWINFVSVAPHRSSVLDRQRPLYMSSLNHAIWLDATIRADEWLHFDCSAPATHGGRGLCVARVHDRRGRMVANVAQECLTAEAS